MAQDHRGTDASSNRYPNYGQPVRTYYSNSQVSDDESEYGTRDPNPLDPPPPSKWWNNSWNPFRTVTAAKTDNHSLEKKLRHTFVVFFGALPNGPNGRELDYQAGVLDILPFFTLPKSLLKGCIRLWEAFDPQHQKVSISSPEDNPDSKTNEVEVPAENPSSWKRRGAKAAALFIFIPVVLPLLIIQAAVALALTIAVSPIVVIVDIFRGPDVTELERKITPARQSFWFNPSTWAMGAVVAFGISLLIQGVNPEVFGLAAASLGVIQGVFVGMTTLLLAAAAIKFVIEISSALYKCRQDEIYDIFEGQKLLSYMDDRWEWMKDHRKTSITISIFTGLALMFAVGLTIAFFTGVPADSFVSLIFDHMSQLLVSLIQAMSHLPGLGFLAGSDAVLLPIAQGLAAAFLIIAPVVLGDSVLRFFYKREYEDEGNFIEMSEGSMSVEGESCGGWYLNTCPKKFLSTNSLSLYSVFEDPKAVVRETGAQFNHSSNYSNIT